MKNYEKSYINHKKKSGCANLGIKIQDKLPKMHEKPIDMQAYRFSVSSSTIFLTCSRHLKLR